MEKGVGKQEIKPEEPVLTTPEQMDERREFVRGLQEPWGAFVLATSWGLDDEARRLAGPAFVGVIENIAYKDYGRLVRLKEIERLYPEEIEKITDEELVRAAEVSLCNSFVKKERIFPKTEIEWLPYIKSLEVQKRVEGMVWDYLKRHMTPEEASRTSEGLNWISTEDERSIGWEPDKTKSTEYDHIRLVKKLLNLKNLSDEEGFKKFVFACFDASLTHDPSYLVEIANKMREKGVEITAGMQKVTETCNAAERISFENDVKKFPYKGSI